MREKIKKYFEYGQAILIGILITLFFIVLLLFVGSMMDALNRRQEKKSKHDRMHEIQDSLKIELLKRKLIEPKDTLSYEED